MNSVAILPRQMHGELQVSDETIGRLLDWVLAASPQEVTWHSDQFVQMRDWLKTHKAAKDLRIKAVRLEMIALRKIGTAGLEGKIKSQMASAAKWLAGLGDEHFTDLLESVSASDTPIGLHRRSVADARDIDRWFENARISDGHALRGIGGEPYQRVDLHNATRRVLEEVTTEGESFTIAEAADRLADALHREGVIEEFSEPFSAMLRGEPLREVVRHVVRTGVVASSYADEFGEEISIPDYVTYTEDDRAGYVRVPWHSAGLEQFRFMVSLRQYQLETMKRKLDQLERALSLMESVVDPAEENPKCDELWSKLLAGKRIEAVTA